MSLGMETGAMSLPGREGSYSSKEQVLPLATRMDPHDQSTWLGTGYSTHQLLPVPFPSLEVTVLTDPLACGCCPPRVCSLVRR